jgi:EAL domain-containing protein (putative c-di-GMP-specific phosphodiesterase class I)
MTRFFAVVCISIADSRRLSDIFGEESARLALTHFGEEATGLLSRLLAQHEVIDRYRADADGHWSAWFRVLSDGLPRDAEEVAETIEQAGRSLIRERLLAVFGGGTGARITADLSVFLLPPEAGARDAKASWLQCTRDQLKFRPKRLVEEQPNSSTRVKAILTDRSIQTMLQPIVRITDGAVMGFEALSRGPQRTPFERPDLLFGAAHAAGCAVEMELLCAELALERTLGKMPHGKFLTINLGPDALALAADKLALAGRQEVMFELTEHLPLNEAEGLQDAVGRLRAIGIRLALDDTGCGFADLDTVRLLKPEIVKLCITVIRNADKGMSFTAAIRASAEKLGGLGSKVLAEGVETTAQHEALQNCGIELAQGWLYGKPEALASVLSRG